VLLYDHSDLWRLDARPHGVVLQLYDRSVRRSYVTSKRDCLELVYCPVDEDQSQKKEGVVSQMNGYGQEQDDEDSDKQR
jgi:hypothetical protein